MVEFFFGAGWTGAMAAVPLVFTVSVMLLFWHRRYDRQRRDDVRLCIRQLVALRALLAGFQRHRGLSNGLYAGDRSLRADVAATRKQVERHIHETGTLMPETAAWRPIVGQWQALTRDEAVDAAVDAAQNLNRHHRLIRHTLFLMEDIATRVDLQQGRAELAYLNCIWREVLQTAEWVGQARALGTGVAAARGSTAGQRVRLRFLHEKIERLSGHAFQVLESATVGQDGTVDFPRAQCEVTVRAFLRCVEQDLLAGEQIRIEPKAFFAQATQAVDELLSLVDVALTHVQRAHRSVGCG